jgi:tripartite-type tricarboxylate transporter receptor subunit TctC
MLRLLAACLSIAASIIVSSIAAAQDWPTKPVRIIVPFGAGGTGDALARVVAEQLSASLKQQFVVENRTGAGGMIGVQALASSAPDGYTVGITNVSTLSLIPVINPKNAYHPLNDFTHVAFVAGAPVSLAVFPKLGVRTLSEFIAYANKVAKPLTFASSGLGSDGHLIGEAIAASTKIKVEHVPYKSTAQALTDVVGGHVVFSTFTLSSSSSFIRAGTLTGIAVTSAERMPDYPELPTFKELGYADLVSSTWFSISGPAKLPKAIVDRLNREITAAMAKPEVQARMRRDGLLTEAMSPEAFTAFVAAESARWTPLIQSTGLAGKGL